MSGTDVVNQLKNLEKAAREARQRRQQLQHGNFSSELSEFIRNRYEQDVTREDLPTVEVVEHVLLFLRGLFAHHPIYQWKSDGMGRTDLDSDIFIESEFSIENLEMDPAKPAVVVRPGPNSDNDLVIGNLKHVHIGTGAVTRTSLETGTIQVLCGDKDGATAARLSNLVKNHIRAGVDDLRARGLHEIRNLTGGGYERGNPMYNRQVKGTTHAVSPITFTYFYQWTNRETPREGVYEQARIYQQSIGVLDGPSDPDSRNRIQGRVELNERLILTDVAFFADDVIDPEEE